ncbi:MAG: RNA methyltransferase [Marinifilaceae bacterium]|nr:RNA methyltransferase [Marinifilaceae bacterium]
MLTNNHIKLFSSLHKKKYRDKEKLFIAEGHKIVKDLIEAGMNARYIIHTEDFTFSMKSDAEIITDSSIKIKKISLLKTSAPIIGIFEIPEYKTDKLKVRNSLSLVLDQVQDPGNLGTIIRLADWFGIENIFCSKETADAFNPKVVQASMGAIARVKIIYTNLSELIHEYKSENFKTYGTFLEGEDIYSSNLDKKGFIIMGNEGNGISQEIEQLISNKITIPSFATNETKSESLNVSIAAAIVCSEFIGRKQ